MCTVDQTEYEKPEPKNTTELLQQKLGEKIPIEFDAIASKFLTISKLDFSGTEIHSGIIKDPTSIGGIRYVVIQPRLSIQDKKNFDIIKKLLMTELSISLTEIKSKKDAEKRLRKKIAQLIRKFKLEIPTKNFSKISYYAIRDFI